MATLSEGFAANATVVADIGATYTWTANNTGLGSNASGQVTSTSTAERGAIPNVAMDSVEHWAEVVVHGEEAGPLVRCAGVGDWNSYYCRLDTPTRVQLYRWFGTFLANFAVASVTLPGTLRLQVSDSAGPGSDPLLEVFWNGLSLGTYTDTDALSQLTGGLYAGIHTSEPTAILDDFAAADLTATTAPDAPTIGTATAGNSQATANWTAPASDGGSAITGYKIERNAGGGAFSTLVANTASTAVSYVDSTAVNGTAYTYRVSAINAVGTSAASAASNSVTPAAAGDVTAPSVTLVPVHLSYTAPTIAPITDSFTRADSAVSIGGDWTTTDGTWGISSNQAYVAVGTTGEVYQTFSADSQIVQARAIASGSENMRVIVARVDANNMVFMQRAPGFATWNLTKLVGGVTTFLGNTGLSAIADVTVKIVRSGDNFQGFVIRTSDGWVYDTAVFSIPEASAGTGVGLGIAAGTTSARFDDFSATIKQEDQVADIYDSAGYNPTLDELTVTVTAVDAESAVTAVEVNVDGAGWVAASFDTGNNWTYTIDVSAWATGDHTIDARATSTGGTTTVGAATVHHNPSGIYLRAVTPGDPCPPAVVEMGASSPVTGDFLLLENGDFLLLEIGDFVLLDL